MTGFRTTLMNAGWLVSDRIVRLVLNVFVGILIARQLGPTGFGLLSYGQVLMTLLLPIATFGMPDILVREFSKSKRDPDALIATALVLRLAFAVIALVVIVGLAIVLRRDNAVAMLVIASYGLSFIPQAFDVIESRFQSLNRVAAVSTLRIINTIVFSAVRLGALVLDVSVVWFALLYSIEILTFAVMSILVAQRKSIRLVPALSNKTEATSLISDSWPMMLRLFAISVYIRIDQLSVGYFLGDSALGIYSAATRLSELWYFAPMAMVAAATPTLTRLYESDPTLYESHLRQLMRSLVLLAVPTAAALSLLSPYVVSIMFGPSYAAAASILAVQAWAGVFVALGVAASPALLITGKIKYGVYQAVCGAATSVCLSIVLIPRYGLMGGAISVLISNLVSALLFNALFPATRKIFWMQINALVLR